MDLSEAMPQDVSQSSESSENLSIHSKRIAEGDSPILSLDIGSSPAAKSSTLTFESGRQVRLDESTHDRIDIFSPDGRFELAIRFTPDGAALTLSAASLDLRCSGALRVACKDLSIHAEQTATLETGTWSETVRETHRTVVGGRSELEAHAVDIRSRLGDVVIGANDDVRITGERILLNR